MKVNISVGDKITLVTQDTVLCCTVEVVRDRDEAHPDKMPPAGQVEIELGDDGTTAYSVSD